MDKPKIRGWGKGQVPDIAERLPGTNPGAKRPSLHHAAFGTSKWPPEFSTAPFTIPTTSPRKARAGGFMAELIGGALSSQIRRISPARREPEPGPE